MLNLANLLLTSNFNTVDMTVGSRLSAVLGHLGNSQKSETLKKSPDDVVIVMAKRSPLCKFNKGGYKDMRSDELMTAMLKSTIQHMPQGVKPADVKDICVGVVQGKENPAKARAAALAAGFPVTTPVQCVNRFCASGLMAISIISNQIRNKEIDCGLAMGVEHLTAEGWAVIDDPKSGLSDEIMAHPTAKDCIMPMGWTSENVAGEFNISREDMDQFAFKSHSRAENAHRSGIFADEIIPLDVLTHDADSAKSKDPKQRKQLKITEDDGLRSTTLESLRKARSAFPQWAPAQSTGGNASQLTDGAAVCLLMTRAKAESLGVPILAKHVATSVAGLEPRIMGIGPVYAIPAVLERCGLTKEDVDLFEINEAFSSMYVYCVKKLGLDVEKVNVNGGAISLGHPYGCTGVRQVATGLNALKRRGQGKVLVTSMCIGLGQAAASVIVLE